MPPRLEGAARRPLWKSVQTLAQTGDYRKIAARRESSLFRVKHLRAQPVGLIIPQQGAGALAQRIHNFLSDIVRQQYIEQAFEFNRSAGKEV